MTASRHVRQLLDDAISGKYTPKWADNTPLTREQFQGFQAGLRFAVHELAQREAILLKTERNDD